MNFENKIIRSSEERNWFWTVEISYLDIRWEISDTENNNNDK